MDSTGPATQTTIKPGDLVTGRPFGQQRRQTMEVTAVVDDTVLGLLISRKFPGDYRGEAAMDRSRVESVEAR